MEIEGNGKGDAIGVLNKISGINGWTGFKICQTAHLRGIYYFSR